MFHLKVEHQKHVTTVGGAKREKWLQCKIRSKYAERVRKINEINTIK